MAEIKKNLAYNFILSASQLLLPLISIPYVSRVIGPQGVGMVSFIDSFTYYFVSIAEFGIVVYGIREVARVKTDKAALGRLVSELLHLHIISSIATTVIYGIAVFFTWNKIHDVRLLLFSFSFLLVNSFACEWYFWGMERFRYITIRSLITRIAGLISIFILVKKPDDYYFYYAAITGAAIANILWNIGNLTSEVRISFKGSGWKKHIRKTWVTYLISLLYSISILLDNVFLGLVSTAAAVGWYAFSIKLVRLSSVALTDTLLVFFPRAVSLLHENKKQEFQEVILKNIKLITLFSIPVSAGIFLLSDEITYVFFGPSFSRVGFDLKLLAPIPFLKCFNLFLSKQVLIVYNQEKLYMKSLLICGLLFIFTTSILSYFYQDRGACYAIIFYEASLLALNFYFTRRTDPNISVFDWQTFFHSIAGIVLFIPVIYFLRRWLHPDWLLLITSVIICVIVYIIFESYVLKNSMMKRLHFETVRLIRDRR